MGSFGFDPSIILSATKTDPAEGIRTLADLALRRTQQQQGQATLADLAYKQQREQTLADIYRRGADAPDALPQELMRGGFGQEAYGAQDQASQMASQAGQRAKTVQEIQEAQRKHIGDLFYGTKDQADYQARVQQLASERDPMLAIYASHLPQQFDPAVTERLGNLALPAEKRAELAKDAYAISENSVTGATTKLNRRTGATSIVAPGGGGAAGGQINAPPGSKMAAYKEGLLDKLAKDLDSTQGKTNLSAKAQTQVAAGERLEVLLNAPGPMTAQRLHEATMMAATIANGGNQPTEAMVESMYPKTLKGKGAEFWQSVLNVPMDTDSKAFVDQLRNQSERESATGKKQIQEYFLGRLIHHPQAFQEFPEDAHRMAEGAGLKGLYDPKTLLPLPPAAEPGALPRVAAPADYAKLPSGAEYLDPLGKRRRKK